MLRPVLGGALAALAFSFPAAALAQRLTPTVVAVVDTDRILRECTACRAAQAQLQTQLTTLQQRQQTLAAPLRTEAEAVQAAVRALPAGRQPDAALSKRITDLQARQNTANQELGRGEQNIQSIQAHVVQQLTTRLQPIINQVMTTRGASIVVSRGAVLSVAPAIDVTNDVLTQLNAALPAVSVTPLPQQPAPAQPTGR